MFQKPRPITTQTVLQSERSRHHHHQYPFTTSQVTTELNAGELLTMRMRTRTSAESDDTATRPATQDQRLDQRTNDQRRSNDIHIRQMPERRRVSLSPDDEPVRAPVRRGRGGFAGRGTEANAVPIGAERATCSGILILQCVGAAKYKHYRKGLCIER